MKETIPYQPELDAIDWRTTARRARHAVVRHVPLIATSVVVALLLLVAYIRIFPPVYRAEAVLLGESNDDVIRSNYYAHWDIFRKGDLKSEPELMTSGRVAKQVVKDLNLKFDDVYHTFFTHVGYLWTESFVGRKYRAFKEWLFPPDPTAYKPTQAEIDFARTVEAFKDGISVEGVPGTAIGKVSVKAPTWHASDIANRAVDVFLAERSRMFKEEAEGAYKSLEAEVKRAAADLAALDREKYEFDVRNKVVLDFEKDKLQVASWSALKTSIVELKALIDSTKAAMKVVDEQLSREPPEIVSSRSMQDSKIKSLLQSRENDLTTALQSAKERYVPTSPEVTELERLLAETRSAEQKQPDKVEIGQERVVNPVYNELRQKHQSLLSQLASAEAMLASKQQPLHEFEKRMDMVPTLVKSTIEQGRIRDGLEVRYKLLRDRLMQADVSRAAIDSAPASMRVIDYANPPMKPMWPKNIILVPSTIAAGLLVGFMLALLAEMFSPRVNRDRLLSRPDIPVYAVIDLRMEPYPALQGAPLALPSAVERLRRLN